MSAVQTSFAAQLAGLEKKMADALDAFTPEAGFAAFVRSKAGTVTALAKGALDGARLREAPYLAGCGYHIFLGAIADQTALNAWRAGILDLERRDPFPTDRQAFFFRPLELLGLALGLSRAFPQEAAERVWMSGHLESTAGRAVYEGADPWGRMLFTLAAHALGRSAVGQIRPRDSGALDAPAHALLIWTATHVAALIEQQGWDRQASADLFLSRALTESWNDVPPGKAGVLASAISICLGNAIQLRHRPVDFLRSVLAGVPAGLSRWRYDAAPAPAGVQWPILEEKHFQDILWLVLRPVFPDIVDEQALPKFGFKQSTPDFAVPSLETLIEVKFIFKCADYKSRFEEIEKDVVEYFHASSQFRRLVVVVYDSVPCPEFQAQFTKDLMRIKGIEDVIVIERPGKLSGALLAPRIKQRPARPTAMRPK